MTDSLNDFIHKFKTKSDEELESWISENAQIGTRASNVAIAELTRRYMKEIKKSIIELKSAIKEFSSSSERYSEKIVWLTRVLVILTVVIAILTGIMAFK